MLIWIAFAVLTAAVLAAVLRPLLGAPAPRGDGLALAEPAADVAVYRDQLAEVQADQARGLLTPDEAENARREIARRLLAAANRATLTAAPDLRLNPTQAAAREAKRAKMAAARGRASAMRQPLATGLALGLPVATLGLYLVLGSPALPGRPFVAVAAAPLANAGVADLIAKVEARLATNPNDVAGWDVIAPVYLRLGRFADAANAYATAMRLQSETTQRLAGFAEASIMAGNGIVSEPARAAYETIRMREPARIEPRFWLALADEQDGKLDKALGAYRALVADNAAASWRPVVDERIAIVEKRLQPSPLPSPLRGGAGAGGTPDRARGPTAADIAAANTMTPADRATMISGMVDGLAQRLAKQPRDLAGWQQLVRAYTVLGDKPKAATALATARATFAGEPASLDQLGALARELGIGS